MMRYCIIGVTFIGLASSGISLSSGSSGIINADFTVKNPEKFVSGKLITTYLDKAEKYLDGIKNDTSLNSVISKGHVRAGKNIKGAYNTNEAALVNTKNISDRMSALSRRLKFSTGKEYADFIQANSFEKIKELIDKDSDPSGILRLDEEDIEKHRGCLYRYLASVFSGKKAATQIRAMDYEDIMNELEASAGLASRTGQLKKEELLKEMATFFNNELAKEEYDMFVDGAYALNRLIIADEKTRNVTLEWLHNLYPSTWMVARQKLLDIQKLLKPSMTE